MLTNNIDTGDRLVNGLIGTVKRLDRVTDSPRGTIYVQFNDPQAGNKYKDRRLVGDLKECVPIQPVVRTFNYPQRSKTRAARKQFPLIVAYAITVHKAQGSTLPYMSGDLDQTSKGKNPAPMSKGMLYTLLSRAKSRDKLQLLNFDKDRHIKTNTRALDEMNRMRTECVLSCNHPLTEMPGNKMCLFNIRSWNLHIQHFMSDVFFPTHSCLFCFTETNINGPYTDIAHYQPNWVNVHKHTQHGLAICYNKNHVDFIEEVPSSEHIENLCVIVELQGERILLVLIYRPPGTIGTFVQQITRLLHSLPTNYRTIVLGDFNLDQMDTANVNRLLPLCTTFNFEQRVTYSTHILGGILDLVFDNGNNQSTEWMPSPYSDHFVVFIQI